MYTATQTTAAMAPPMSGPTTGIQEYSQSLLPLPGIGRMACMIRGPRSRAGLIAYPVVPPSERPITRTSRATAKGPDARWRSAEVKITKTSTNVPMISEIRFQSGLRIAGAGAEDGELEALVLGLSPVRVVVQEDQRGADERADELGDEVQRDLVPRRLAGDRKAEGDGRVQVRTAVRGRHHDAREDGHRPREGDDDPARVVGLRLAEEDTRDHAVAEQDQDHRPDQFGNELLCRHAHSL